mgnify:CR=1 FL=1
MTVFDDISGIALVSLIPLLLLFDLSGITVPTINLSVLVKDLFL